MAQRILKIDIHDFTTRALKELTAAETGILMRLLIADAEHGGLPAETDALCAIARVGREKWDRGLGKKMKVFFTVAGNRATTNIIGYVKARQETEKEKSISTLVVEYWKTEFLKRNGEYPVNPTAATILAVNGAIKRLVRADAKRYTLDVFEDIVDYGFERDCPTLAVMLTEFSINKWMQDTGGIKTGKVIKKRERDKFLN